MDILIYTIHTYPQLDGKFSQSQNTITSSSYPPKQLQKQQKSVCRFQRIGLKVIYLTLSLVLVRNILIKIVQLWNLKMPFAYKRPILSSSLNKSLQNVKQEKEEYLSQDQERGSMGGSDEENNDVHEGRWSDQQNYKFILFVSYYQNIFASKSKRKNSKIFKTLSQYMSQRTSSQCRSHFQKLLVKFKTVAKIKKYYVNLYGQQQFSVSFERFKQEWEQRSQQTIKLNIPQIKEIGVQTEQMFLKKEFLLSSHSFGQEMRNVYPFWNEVKWQGYCHPYIFNFKNPI